MGRLEDTLVYRFRREDGQPFFRGRADLAESEFSTGYELVREPQLRDPGCRRQTADEYLVFGAETMNAGDFDGEVLVTLGRGEEAEVYTIDRPATVRIPAGVWRGPVEFRRVNRPIFYQDMRMQDSAAPMEVEAGEPVRGEGNPARRFKNLIFFNVPERAKGYFGQEFHENTEKDAEGVGIRGACQLPGAKHYLGGGFTKQAVRIDPFPHKHDHDEYLAFMGSPADPFDMDVHIEMTLGLGEEAETFSVDQPAIIRIPAGTWHCPLDFMRVDKPFFFEVVLQQGNFGGIYHMPDGDKPIYYNGMIDCILEPGKHCNTCQRCLQLEWDSFKR